MSAERGRPAQRRRTLRVPLEVRLVGVVGGAWAVDLSEGGMCLQLADPPPVAASLVVRFQLPGWKEITAQVEVVWVDEAPSVPRELRYREIGVRFLELPGPEREAIRHFVDERSSFRPQAEA